MGYGDRDYYRPTGFGGFSFFPDIIKKILIINGIIFFIQMLFDNITFGGIPGGYFLNRYFALNPLVGYDSLNQPYNFQIWQLITYQFMHGDFMHILFNMFMLWMFGMEIENHWGAKKFLFFYLLAGVVGAVLQLISAPFFGSGLAPTIGASGAVYGIMVTFAMFFPDRYIYLYFLLPVKAKYLIGFIVVFELMAVGNVDLVAHLVHIGGAVSAFVFVMLDRKHQFNIDGLYSKIKRKISMFGSEVSNNNKSSFRKPFSSKDSKVKDAKFYDINNHDSQIGGVSQSEIDKILDKISESGYQNLTEEEKRKLFEASKKD